MNIKYACCTGTAKDPIIDHYEDIYWNAIEWMKENGGWIHVVVEYNEEEKSCE